MVFGTGLAGLVAMVALLMAALGIILLAFPWSGVIWRVAPGPSPNGLEPCLATDWACSGRWEHGQANLDSYLYYVWDSLT